jgi:hypothetical protein
MQAIRIHILAHNLHMLRYWLLLVVGVVVQEMRVVVVLGG